MAPLKPYRAAERELMEALSDVVRKDGAPQQLGECPSVAELRRFVAGKSTPAQRDELLAHLGSCDRCISLLRQIRERRVTSKRVSLVLAAAAILAIAVWATLERSSSVSRGVTTVDLRLISPTRGIDNNNRADAVMARHKAERLRIVLPIGGEGKYECQILRPGRTGPLLRTSGDALLENHDVVLNLPVELGRLTPGRYSLALRREGSEWVYYPLILE